MTRSSLTYEQVAAAASALVASGVEEPGARAIREELARRAAPGDQVGSPNTIQRHLEAWRAGGRPGAAVRATELAPQLVAALGGALTSAASEARRPLEAQLSQVRIELADLVASGEASDATIDELKVLVSARTSERDDVTGQLRVRETQIQALQQELDSTRSRLSVADSELLNARASVQATEARVDEIRSLTNERLVRVESELAEARIALAESERRAFDAAARAASCEARLDEVSAVRRDQERQLIDLRLAAGSLQGEAGRLLAAEAEAAGLREQVGLLRQTVETLRVVLRRADDQHEVRHRTAAS